MTIMSEDIASSEIKTFSLDLRELSAAEVDAMRSPKLRKALTDLLQLAATGREELAKGHSKSHLEASWTKSSGIAEEFGTIGEVGSKTSKLKSS
jgi:hypothetical protein